MNSTMTSLTSATPITYNNGTIEELWGNTTHHRVAYKLSSRPVFYTHLSTKYTIEEINSYIEPYDYWYNTNNIKLGK